MTMYCVDVIKYRKDSQNITRSLTFETLESAMQYVDLVRDYNMWIWLTQYESDERGNLIEGLPICLHGIYHARD